MGVGFCLLLVVVAYHPVSGDELDVKAESRFVELPPLSEAHEVGRSRSAILAGGVPAHPTDAVPVANLADFKKHVAPVLRKSCVECHGPTEQNANLRVDSLDPDLLKGSDIDHWLEVFDVVSNGEMPPEGADVPLTDAQRRRIVDWLSTEIQAAGQIQHANRGHSSFRRLTKYEFNYALQDLLGLPYEFASDLPPETRSKDGFLNSSETLQLSVTQFELYRQLARRALNKATVRGERPEPFYFALTMRALFDATWNDFEADLAKIDKKHKNDPERLELELRKFHRKWEAGGSSFIDTKTGQSHPARWSYLKADKALPPTSTLPPVPEEFAFVAQLPRPGTYLTVDVRNRIPDTGNLRVRVLASRLGSAGPDVPILGLEFGHKLKNSVHVSEFVSPFDVEVEAGPDRPQFLEWNIPLSEVPRNPYRKTSELGDRLIPNEFLRLQNTSLAPEGIRIYFVEVAANAYEQWPPESHRRIFPDDVSRPQDEVYAREIFAKWMRRAWRRPPTKDEIDKKVALYAKYRAAGIDFQESVIEVLTTVLSSPNFLYLIQTRRENRESQPVSDFELATRLSFFLWSSLPDEELLALAEQDKLSDQRILNEQVERMLADGRSRRFSQHFVYQWLGMHALDFLDVDRETYPKFNAKLKQSMQAEPVAFFNEVLSKNRSVMEFIHSDYAMLDERLARHYGIRDVRGNSFRRVMLSADSHRGGLLTQAGLLAMNSDGIDSHPVKRGVWLLECILHDPPPPPPPNVPQVDLTDPEILKLTLKERIENHRSSAACYSCHAKIDPWGIAFEGFDAVGSWRTKIDGQPVDAVSELFNKQPLDGVDGLKRVLLTYRQDQFARAMVHKLTSYALGRPLSFSDRSQVDRLTAQFRQSGDRLGDLVRLIIASELFRSK